MRIKLLIAMLLIVRMLFAQNDWWYERYNNNPVRAWYKYMKVSPHYLGPNALPTNEYWPFRLVDSIDRRTYVFSLNQHFNMNKERVTDLKVSLVYKISPRLNAILRWNAIEFYHVSDAIIAERTQIDTSKSGVLVGDMHLNFAYQLINQKEYAPSVQLRFSYTIPLGNGLPAARKSDLSTYCFGAHFGWNKNKHVNIYTSSGLYVYQTYDVYHPQNDALFYTFGIQTDVKAFSIIQEISGYRGYLDLKDKPMVYRVVFLTKSENFTSGLKIQIGLYNWEYQTFSLILAM